MSLALARPAFSLTSLAPRFLQPIFARPQWSIPCEPSSSASTLSSAETVLPMEAPTSNGWNISIPSLGSLLELIPGIMLAAPKRKTSHSKKRMRMAGKWLRNKTNFVVCGACGNVHLMHHLCPNCYSQISRRWKAENRGDIQTSED